MSKKICLLCMVLILCLSGCGKQKPVFEEGVVMHLNDGDVTMNEFLLYASSIVRECEEVYGEDVWQQEVTLENGDEFSFADYTKIQIVEQIRMTHLLAEQAESYGVSLSEEEQAVISDDAEAYYRALLENGVDTGEMSFPLILSVYEQCALAEKVFQAMTADLAFVDGLSEEEIAAGRMDAFSAAYQKLSKEYYPDWDIYQYADMDSIFALIFDEDTELNVSDIQLEGEVEEVE